MLELHGREGLQPELNRMSKEGRWLEMIGKIDDDLFDTIGVSGTPSEVGARLRERNTFADRTTLILYNETEPDAVTDLIRASGNSHGAGIS